MTRSWNPMAQQYEPAPVEPAEFLLARIAEDEEAAKWASVSDYNADWTLLRSNTVQFGKAIAAQMSERAAPHVARWHPARVLAECEAKRRIVAEHGNDRYDCRVCAEEESFSDDSEGNREFYRSAKLSPCPTLRLLALPFADHPDWREEWRP